MGLRVGAEAGSKTWEKFGAIVMAKAKARLGPWLGLKEE